MTEDEAKTKWCPASRAANKNNDADVSIGGMNRWRGEEHLPKGTRCIGSACMWWRWDDVPNPDYDPHQHGISGIWPPLRMPPMTIKSDTDGHCGVAGRP